MYLCGPGKHSCQPFCGPEGRFYCSYSVCSLWPAPFSYLCVSVRILCVLKIVCGWASKTWLLPYACCGLHFIDSAACVLSFDHATPLHIYIYNKSGKRSIYTSGYTSVTGEVPTALKGPWTLILTDFSFRSLWYIPPTKYFLTVNTGIYPVPQ